MYFNAKTEYTPPHSPWFNQVSTYLLVCLQPGKKSRVGCEELYGDSISMSRTLDATFSLSPLFLAWAYSPSHPASKISAVLTSQSWDLHSNTKPHAQKALCSCNWSHRRTKHVHEQMRYLGGSMCARSGPQAESWRQLLCPAVRPAARRSQRTINVRENNEMPLYKVTIKCRLTKK